MQKVNLLLCNKHHFSAHPFKGEYKDLPSTGVFFLPLPRLEVPFGALNSYRSIFSQDHFSQQLFRGTPWDWQHIMCAQFSWLEMVIFCRIQSFNFNRENALEISLLSHILDGQEGINYFI